MTPADDPMAPHRDDPMAPHRDDGPIGARAPAARIPVPEVALLAVSLALMVAALVAVPTAGLRFGLVSAAWLLAVLGASARPVPRLRWPVPALLRGIEYLGVLGLAGGTAWSYALLATLAFHHYDIVYRVRLLGSGPPRWLELLGGGWSVRLAVLLAASALDVTGPATTIMTLLLAPLFLGESIASWVSAHRPAAQG